MRREFTAEAPGLVWCRDTTEIDTGEGKLYLATVIGLFSRRRDHRLLRSTATQRMPLESPIDYEHDYWAGFTEELAAQEGLHETRRLASARPPWPS
ncbi:hypothetical protein ACWCQS_41185 [Streptomyces sp. NPDC002076]